MGLTVAEIFNILKEEQNITLYPLLISRSLVTSEKGYLYENTKKSVLFVCCFFFVCVSF